jgi:hypothetical protein
MQGRWNSFRLDGGQDGWTCGRGLNWNQLISLDCNESGLELWNFAAWHPRYAQSEAKIGNQQRQSPGVVQFELEEVLHHHGYYMRRNGRVQVSSHGF